MFGFYGLGSSLTGVINALIPKYYSLDFQCEKLKDLAFFHAEYNIKYLDQALSAKILLSVSHEDQEWIHCQIILHKPSKEEIKTIIDTLISRVKNNCTFFQDKQIKLAFGILMKVEDNLFAHSHFSICGSKDQTNTLSNGSCPKTRHSDDFISWSALITPNHPAKLIDELGNFT